MPEIDGGEYVWAAFLHMRPCGYGAGSIVPRGWPDVLAFAQATNAVCEPWEMTALEHMSAAYVEERLSGGDVFRIPPMERGQHG